MTKKKILLFVQWFVPGYKAGGPINSCKNFVLAMENEFDIWIMTTNRDVGDEVDYPNIETNQWIDFGNSSKVCYLPEGTISKNVLSEKINEINPDFLYLNSLYSPVFTVPILSMTLKNKLKTPIILTPRGELNLGAIAIKWYKKIPYLALLRLFGLSKKVKWQATNSLERDSIKKFFGGDSKIEIVSNFPKQASDNFQTIEKTSGSVKLISVSRIAKIKNISFFLSILPQVNGNVVFDVYGPKEDIGYFEKLQLLSKKLPPSITFNYKGQIQPNLIEQTLQQYHFFVSPSQGENFGHAIFEALLMGRPLQISDRTPWLDLQKKGIGWDLSLNKKDDWVSAIQESVDMGNERYQEMSKSSRTFALDYIESSDLVKQAKKLFSES